MSHKKAKRERKADRRYTRLEKHTREGRTLVPPIMTYPQMVLRSWVNDRLPEMLWAALLVTSDREVALRVFRKLAAHVASIARDKRGILESVTHSSIAAASPQIQEEVIDIIASTPVGKSRSGIATAL